MEKKRGRQCSTSNLFYSQHLVFGILVGTSFRFPRISLPSFITSSQAQLTWPKVRLHYYGSSIQRQMGSSMLSPVRVCFQEQRASAALRQNTVKRTANDSLWRSDAVIVLCGRVSIDEGVVKGQCEFERCGVWQCGVARDTRAPRGRKKAVMKPRVAVRHSSVFFLREAACGPFAPAQSQILASPSVGSDILPKNCRVMNKNIRTISRR